MLIRFDPFRDLERAATRGSAPVVPMDAVKRDDQVVVRFDLPGVDPDAIDVEVERNVLTVTAERRWAPAEGEQVLASERRHGAFSRQLLLSDTLDAANVAASYDHGVLTVTIPTAETAKPRKVSVGSANVLDTEELDSGS
jgi:HSP20 family protein